MSDEGGQSRTALVTGASSGIGQAFARELARRGHDVVITARREDRLRELARELESSGVRAHVVVADLADPAAPLALLEQVASAGVQLDVLINNAGYGINARYVETGWQQQAALIQVMITALSELCHRVLPGMLERGFGRIVNVSSVAGLIPGTAGATLYGAAKSYVIKLSEALALELQGRGVHVCALCPGYTYSEFHDVNGTRAEVSQLPRVMWMDAERVASQGLDAVERGEVVYVNGAVNRAVVGAVKHSPDALNRALMRRMARSVRRMD